MPHAPTIGGMADTTPIAGSAASEGARAAKAFRLPAMMFGIGLGGFFDGIVLHQILQWHHMVSEPYPPESLANLQLNTVADGLFHLGSWVITLVGAILTYRTMGRTRARPSGRILLGGLLAGWGLFNIVEGLIDHHILGLHHVRPGPDELLFDLGFLAWGGLMLVIGALLLRARPEATANPT